MTAKLRPRPVLGDPAVWQFPDVADHRLANGLRVLAVQLPGKRVATATLLLDMPVDSDPRGQEGLAVLAARSLSEGTQTLVAEAFAAALESQGASFRTSAGYEGLTATVDVPVSRLASALPLLADATVSPAFPEHEVDRVLRQRLAEITQDLSNPPARCGLELGALLYEASSRMSRPAAGTRDSIEALTAQAISAGYASRVSAATATLVLAGDLGGLDVVELADTAFGRWDAKSERWTPTEPVAAAGPRALVVDRPGSVQTQILLAHPAGGRTAPHWPAANLATYALGGTLTSRIDAVLREEKGYTYGMRAGLAPSRRSSTLQISGSVDTGNTAPALQDLMTVLETATRDGLRADELAAARNYLVGVSPMRWETPAAVAGQVASVIGNDLPVSWIDAYLDGMRSTSLDALNAALRTEVRPEDLVVVAVGEADAIVGPLQDLGFGAASVVTA